MVVREWGKLRFLHIQLLLAVFCSFVMAFRDGKAQDDPGNCIVGPEEQELVDAFPNEVVEKLLRRLALEEVLVASEVCHRWNTLIRNPSFWQQYYERHRRLVSWSSVHDHVAGRPDEWAVHFAVCKRNLIGTNLLANPQGYKGFQKWTIIDGGDPEEMNSFHTSWHDGLASEPYRTGWTIKTLKETPSDPEHSVDFVPPICFATDQYSCTKFQLIDLWDFGFTPAVIRACVPFTIKWSVYVGTPQGHEGYYDLSVRFMDMDSMYLLNLDSSGLTYSSTLRAGLPFTEIKGSCSIQKGKDEFEAVRKLRYIWFSHGGMAKDNDCGTNGPHIYRPSVRITLGANDALGDT